MQKSLILADGRWSGIHGIGRFSHEVLSRIQHIEILKKGPAPLSFKNLFWQPYFLRKQKNKYKAFFTPGFNPVYAANMLSIITIADLIHLYGPEKNNFVNKAFYEFLVKPSLHQSYKILTVSEYSKKTICEWANISPDKIVNVGCGISKNFTPIGEKHQPGYPYLFNVGNTKSHKNIPRLLHALALSSVDCKLILTGQCTKKLSALIQKNHLENRVIFSNALDEIELAKYYRGAQAIVFPSLYEGFGLPLLEAFASGVPVLTSDVTSLPEVAGNAALCINPLDENSIAVGLQKIVGDEAFRKELIMKGLQRAKDFSWDKTAEKIQSVLDCVLAL